MFYKIITQCGHAGAGSSFEKVWFIKGKDPVAVLTKARRLPGVKSKDTSNAIKLVKEISRGEYRNGIMTKRSI